jgi:hypothetical protein
MYRNPDFRVAYFSEEDNGLLTLERRYMLTLEENIKLTETGILP